MRDQLLYAVQQAPLKWTLDLRKALTASAIAASNTIEGYQVDAKDVADLMDGEREVEASDENKAKTLAYQQAMTYIQSLHDVADFRYSKELLNSLHWMLQGHHHPIQDRGTVAQDIHPHHGPRRRTRPRLRGTGPRAAPRPHEGDPGRIW
ncbi:hypothetical protein [Streptomyces sp900116325]|uniref:hypothetical protein n=1 Tax=Streptomyces sp. 900116325 TaxID=3154295 RepID=UPI0033A67B00